MNIDDDSYDRAKRYIPDIFFSGMDMTSARISVHNAIAKAIVEARVSAGKNSAMSDAEDNVMTFFASAYGGVAIFSLYAAVFGLTDKDLYTIPMWIGMHLAVSLPVIYVSKRLKSNHTNMENKNDE